eukprot:SAG11_NODE_1792_length_4254_cov_20.360770_2_plen_106_part_00
MFYVCMAHQKKTKCSICVRQAHQQTDKNSICVRQAHQQTDKNSICVRQAHQQTDKKLYLCTAGTLKIVLYFDVTSSRGLDRINRRLLILVIPMLHGTRVLKISTY